MTLSLRIYFKMTIRIMVLSIKRFNITKYSKLAFSITKLNKADLSITTFITMHYDIQQNGIKCNS
jgi:hypothetical protein